MHAQNVLLWHEYTHKDVCATHCVINDASLETIPDIDQPLLQFIDVTNFRSVALAALDNNSRSTLAHV